MRDEVTLWLAGDVMLGRGIDQLLADPVDPRLWEAWITDARDYVALAERVAGPIPRPVAPSYPWGEALAVLDADPAGVRIFNLETSVTRGGAPVPGKGIHYRMSPGNLAALRVARPDVCALANNHVLDFSRRGLADTLAALTAAGITTAGAGLDRAAARRPATVTLPTGGRLHVLSVGLASSGIPTGWAATDDRSGVDLVGTSRAEVTALADRVRRLRRPGDLVLVSVHWGGNWGHDVAEDETRLARALVDAGADVVHGHSSHHPRPMEVHRGRLILYGCGDLVNDYEGIGGHTAYRPELRVLYRARLTADGAVTAVELLVLRSRRLRLETAADDDVAWLGATLDRVGRPWGVGVRPHGRTRLRLALPEA